MEKILFIDDTGRLGGAQISLLGLVTNLDRSRFYPILLCRNDGPVLRKAASFGVETLPANLRGLKRPLGFLVDLFSLSSFLKRRKISLVHVNSPFLFKYAALLSSFVSIPSVGHMRDIVTLGGIDRWFFNRVDHIIAISESVRKSLEESRVRTPISVIHNGVNLDTFYPSIEKRRAFRQKHNIAYDEITVGICSRIAPEKGHRTFLEAARIVAAKKPNVKFVIAGDAVFDLNLEFKRKMAGLVREWGMQSVVLWTGFTEKTDELFPGLDILVVASHAEPFGRVVIEAGACATPVIGTAAGGIPEIVQDGETGMLVPPKNPALVAEAILELSHDKEKRTALGQNLRKRVIAHFNLNRQVECVERLYEVLLGS